jgi:serine protease Do
MQQLDWLNETHIGIVHITTPFSSGTGFLLADKKYIITNEHVIRDNKKVVVDGHGIKRQSVEVIFFDELYDIAFLAAPVFTSDFSIDNKLPDVASTVRLGDPVFATGHPLGLKFSTTKGIISSLSLEFSGIKYIQHDAALNPGNSGGPLYNIAGEIVGVNTFIHKDGNNIGIALPVSNLIKIISEYEIHYPNKAIKCASCETINQKLKKQNNYCINCGNGFTSFDEIDDYVAIGISKKIEDIIIAMEYNPDLCRKGQYQWEVKKGSASMTITYHEKSGYLIAESVLCYLHNANMLEIYNYLLKQNYYNKEMSFSIKENSIIISTTIYDQYLKADSGKKIFQRLLDNSDKYDNILIDHFGTKMGENEV